MPAIKLDEASVVAIGQALLSAARQTQPRLYRGVSGYLLTRSLNDAAVRAALFRYIDVLPQLHGSKHTAQHLKAYLDEADSDGLLSSLLRLTARPSLAWLGTLQIKRMARNFLAEENAVSLAAILAQLQTLPASVTLDAVGEAVLTDAEADAYRDRVLWQLAQDWQGQAPHLSIKLTALTPRFDPLDPTGTRRRVFARLAPILEAAANAQATVTVDMEQHELKELILNLFLDAASTFNDSRWLPAIALQAYLPETSADIQRVIASSQKLGRKLGVRLVKGAYWDQERAWAAERGWPMPCFTDKPATDAHYEQLTALLLANTDCIMPAIAGHNPRSLAVAIAHAQAQGLNNQQWEIQMLYGMAEPLRDAIAQAGLPLRIYVPTGELLAGIAYLIRRLLENTASTSVLRQTYLDSNSDAALLAAPQSSESVTVQTFPATLPLSDFSQATVRGDFAASLAELTHALPLQTLNESEDLYISRSPQQPERVIGAHRITPLHELNTIIAEAQAAQKVWVRQPLQTRLAILLKLADVIEQERHRYAALQVLEAGKPWREADADVAEAIDFLRYYVAQMQSLAGAHRTVDFPGEQNCFSYRPRGIAVVIAPWNFPLAILTGMTTAALVTGNAAIMKPALPGLQSARALRTAMDSVGIPAALCPLLVGGPELGHLLVAHPYVNVIAFTGSRSVGLEILRNAHTPQPGQRHVKQVVCEMGGKNAIIVDEDADLDEAVSGIIASAFGYSGQKCSACSRVIAVGAVAEQLLPRLIAAAATLQWGDPSDPANDHGPLISASAQQKALDYIAIGGQEANMVWQGHVPLYEKSGWFCPPTIFADVKPEHRIAREEIFAPILALLSTPNFATALQIANDCDYALTGGVYSRLPEHLATAAEQFQVGNLYLNRRTTGARVGVQPFGGIALSGTGVQAGGPDYLKQFMWMQTVSSNVLRRGFVPDSR
ncbi:MAG TPA: proline dehydrogenase family protein [Rhodocyclaceae bacterium]|nr:proline dehydrogenase family protein [Rhodocyclaceae bacterium]